MNHKLLGILGMIGSPFLFLTFIPGLTGEETSQNSSLRGLFELIYMSGWICSLIGLAQLKATGTNSWGRWVLIIQFLFLTLANIWNIWNIFQPNANTTLYRILDFTWPASNTWMLVVAITIAIVHRLEGWRRWISLVVGLWLPFGLLMMVVLGRNDAALYIAGIHSAVAWFLLGYMIWTTPAEYPIHPAPSIA